MVIIFISLNFLFILLNNKCDLHGRGLEFGQHPGDPGDGDANEVRVTFIMIIYFRNPKITMICMDGVLSLANTQGQTGMRMKYESWLLCNSQEIR